MGETREDTSQGGCKELLPNPISTVPILALLLCALAGGHVPMGAVSPQSSPTSRFMAPWAPLFVKGRSGALDTGTDEDEFPSSAVHPATPLILRVWMMNFFLSPIFFFIYFPSVVPSLRPATAPS